MQWTPQSDPRITARGTHDQATHSGERAGLPWVKSGGRSKLGQRQRSRRPHKPMHYSSITFDHVVGRTADLQAASEFLAALATAPAGLVFAGEPGIGKTTLWTQVIGQARDRGMTVLSARPVAAEARLAFAVLADLLGNLPDSILARLPEPQRHALAVALLREEAGGRGLDQRAVGAAAVGVLTELCKYGRVIVAIDDVQWLDRPSARVLAFAIRRLGGLPVGLLACTRVDSDQNPVVDRLLALPEGLTQLRTLGPLSASDVHEIVEARLGRSLPRRTLARIDLVAGGNPFYAVEVARSLPDYPPPGQAVVPVPVPDNLNVLVAARLALLALRARRALLPVAVLRSPTVSLVAAGMGSTLDGSLLALRQATAAGIVEVAGTAVRFTHPLFASAVYSSASAGERRHVHRNLAAVIDDVEERAWHLALAAEAPDAGLAELLDSAAEHARARGAPETAFELTEQALELTPPDRTVDVHRRRVRAAEYRYHAGDLQGARHLLEFVASEAPENRVRADALRLLGEVCYHQESFPEAVKLFAQALEHAADDIALISAVELHLAYASNASGDFSGAEPHVRRALALAEQVGDMPQLAEAIAVSSMVGFLLGRGVDEPEVNRALRLEDRQRQTTVEMRPSLIAGLLMLYVGRLNRACELLSDLRQRILDRGEESDLPYVSACLAWAESWRGNLAPAAGFAAEAIDIATRTGMASMRCTVLALGSVPLAFAGDAETARDRAREALMLAAHTGYGIGVVWAGWSLAVLSLSERDPAGAYAALAPAVAQVEREGVTEPVLVMFLADGIEALIGIGQLDRADHLTDMLERAARSLGREWALVQAIRCRALLHAARGDLAAASLAAREACCAAESLDLRLEYARTLLVAGEIERRGRHRGRACDLHRQALEIFEAAGAKRWAERARLEISRVTARHPGDGLTESEKLVADLVVSGLTNQQVAARLFISPKTVEANLARAYRKLGVRSRAELGARLATTASGAPIAPLRATAGT
jgi:DNA-binding CsgD family transcriptional regulator